MYFFTMLYIVRLSRDFKPPCLFKIEVHVQVHVHLQCIQPIRENMIKSILLLLHYNYLNLNDA